MSLDESLICMEVYILHQHLALGPDGPGSPFVGTATHIMKYSLIPSYATGWMIWMYPAEELWWRFFQSSGFCFIKCGALLDNATIPFDIMFINSFKTPFKFRFFIKPISCFFSFKVLLGIYLTMLVLRGQFIMLSICIVCYLLID